MFAFSYFDNIQKKLTARDSLGIKRMYYFKAGAELCFLQN